MSNNERTHQDKETTIHRIARSIADALAEDHDVQRFLVQLRLNPQNYVFRPGRAPATYTDFLFCTSGVLIHEPSARERALGYRHFG
jgi:hypothetical protein